MQPGIPSRRESQRAPDLPEYGDPPLVEVVLSTQFAPISAVTTAHLGVLWTRYWKKFSRVEERPPLARVNETLEAPGVRDARVSFSVFERPPAPRLWFLKADGTELIQVQEDRFIHNWRKVGEDDAYPRFETIRERFRTELADFQTFLAEESLGEFLPDLAEITYVNHIIAGDGWESLKDLERVFTFWRTPDDIGEIEDAQFSARLVLRGEDGDPIGRLYLKVTPAYRNSDKVPIFRMDLTARGAPLQDPTDDGVVAFMNVGRDSIVRAFTAATTAEMHKAWGRKQ